MIRNLKVLLAAALALAAIGAFSASAAQAAEFRCGTTNCVFRLKPDGTGATAHHVFVVETANTSNSVSFTCAELKGQGFSATANASVLTAEKLEYPTAGCKVNGSPGVTVDMNGCNYKFTSTGTVSVVGCTNAAKRIEITISGGCIFSIPESAVQNLTGVAYHTSGVSPNRELTAEVNHVTIQGITTNGAPCESLIGAGHSTGLVGTYTTGNTIVTGETEAETMKESWFE